MNSIYLFTAPVAEVNRGLWAVKREGLHGTGHLVLDAENFKLNTYIKPHQHRTADLCVHTLYEIVGSISCFLKPALRVVKSNLEEFVKLERFRAQ